MKPYTVSEINDYINQLITRDFILADLKVEGEISNFSHPRSGHMYFILKDENSKLKSVMFKGNNLKLKITPKDGMKVKAQGRISLYPREGIYQFYISDMEELGRGDLYRQFEELKSKLKEEGLFDPMKKKSLPTIPKNIGVVTSGTGAAVKDIITVIKRRFPPSNIFIYPSLVQGDLAAENIVKALKYFESREDIDLVIFGRGGGSFEDLFAFNDEGMARYIFEMETPTISAVGHDIDFSISDFVSDVRAATPSVAGELAVPDLSRLNKELRELYKSMLINLSSKLNLSYEEIKSYKKELKLLSPISQLNNNRMELDYAYKNLLIQFTSSLDSRNKYLDDLEKKLFKLDPKLRLEGGQVFLLNEKGENIKSIHDIEIKDKLRLILKDGSAETVITRIEEDEI